MCIRDSFGVGEWMNNDFVSGAKGLLPEHEYYNKYYGRTSWNSSTIISMAIGQGELLLTPIQMANIAAIIANKGFYYTPHIIKSIEGENNIDSSFTKKKYTTISKKNYDLIIEGMEKVIKNSNGTAHNIQSDEIVICGKTGTAQNPHGEDHSIFIAFAPKEDPKIALAVYVENGGWGSKWAAPIASLIIEKYTNSNKQGVWDIFSEQVFLSTLPCSEIIIASPGLTSLSKIYPSALRAELSDATMKDPSSFLPRTKGLMPLESLKPTRPTPSTRTATANPPSHLL